MAETSGARKQVDSRYLLAAIVDSSEDAIVSKDLNGIIKTWNSAAEKLFGYQAEEIVGKSVLLLIPEELQYEEPRIIAKLKAGERIEHYESIRVRKDGTRFPVALTISPIKDETGAVIGGSKIARDITEAKTTQEARSRLAAIVESSDDAIISKDLNGIVTSWNKGAQRIFGYSAIEMIGRSITTIIPPELQSDEPKILSRLRAGEKIDHFETIRLTKNQERIHVSLTVSPVRDETGKIVGAAKIARDITSQKQLEAALHMTERLASVGRLAASVAHEINNPLEAVTNFIYLAAQQPGLPEKVKRYLSLADKELGRVASLAQQTLGFYRRNTNATEIDIGAILQEVLEIYERKLLYKNLFVEQRVDPELTLHGFSGELKQILSNVIGNSIDAVPTGGKIVVRATHNKLLKSNTPAVRITIADNGHGIPGEIRKKIFTPFFTTKREVGTGLGLWITRDLVVKAGGAIRFRSRVGDRSGTVVSFLLPVQTQPHERVQ